MNLTYRGQPYKISPFIRFSSGFVDQSKIKLIYRGQTYNPTSRSILVSKTVRPNQPTVTLTYRGVTHDRTFQSPDFINSFA
jgi:hypothetical protein